MLLELLLLAVRKLLLLEMLRMLLLEMLSKHLLLLLLRLQLAMLLLKREILLLARLVHGWLLGEMRLARLSRGLLCHRLVQLVVWVDVLSCLSRKMVTYSGGDRSLEQMLRAAIVCTPL